MMRFWIVSVLLIVSQIRSPVFGQGTRADYERSKNLDWLAEGEVKYFSRRACDYATAFAAGIRSMCAPTAASFCSIFS
jgi:hypothetical protein